MSTRRRAFVLLALALAGGGLATSRVREHERRVEERLGPGVAVVVSTRDVRAGSRVPRSALGLRSVPARWVPADAIGSLDDAVGARSEVGLVRGAYVTAGALAARSGSRRQGMRPGERAVEVAVTGGAPLAAAGPGALVDVLVSSDGRTVVALEGVELLALGGAGPRGEPVDDRPAAQATATLRVTPRQAVYLAAAENFAREVRLLVRPPGDRRRTGAAAVSAGEL